MSKILITGGHLTPALSFIDYCQQKQPLVEIVFAGREFAQLANHQPSWEKEEIQKRKIKFIPFDGVKSSSFNPLAFIKSCHQARKILKAHHITHVLSFGGYLAVPFALGAKKLKLSLITHEQTRVLGKANRLISPFVDFIALSFSQTKTLFPAKVVFTGNPLRQQLFHAPQKAPTWFKPSSTSLPIIYLAGGSQGSQTLNDNFLPILNQLSLDYIIIHQVGRASEKFQPLITIQKYLQSQGLSLPNYYPREFLTVEELAYFLPILKFAISRAGANTVAELTAFQIPTLYIPLPFANYQEQMLNAQTLVQKQAALLLNQAELLPSSLLEKINDLSLRAKTIRANLSPFSSNQRANEKIFSLLIKAGQKHSPQLIKTKKMI